MAQHALFEEYFCDNWKDVIDKMTEGLMLVDPTGKILFVNAALEGLLLYSRGELVGKRCDFLECDACFEHRQEYGNNHCPLFRKGDVRNLKCSFKRKDGTKVHVLKNATTLTDSSGKIVGGVENLTDMTAIVTQAQVISDLRQQIAEEDAFQGMIGKSHAMSQVFALIKNAALSEAPVVIYGESGTGKELVTSAIHTLSTRQNAPLIKVNCAALNENLLESELFGHIKGAFTGADRSRMGRFEAADHGVIFLDEIGDLPLATQTKLLRVIQEQEIERVGDHQPIAIDVRIIAATNKDLSKLMAEEKFRDDLYYRIGVIPIILPPLRERQEDIPLLIETFLNRARLKTGKDIKAMDKDALNLMVAYSWPGNIRELINVIEYAFVICPSGVITPAHLPHHFTGNNTMSMGPGTFGKAPGSDRRQLLVDALKQTGGNKSEAARLLGISRVTLWKQLKKHEITVDKAIGSPRKQGLTQALR
jgi:two-component system response regulator HydG